MLRSHRRRSGRNAIASTLGIYAPVRLYAVDAPRQTPTATNSSACARSADDGLCVMCVVSGHIPDTETKCQKWSTGGEPRRRRRCRRSSCASAASCSERARHLAASSLMDTTSSTSRMTSCCLYTAPRRLAAQRQGTRPPRTSRSTSCQMRSLLELYHTSGASSPRRSPTVAARAHGPRRAWARDLVLQGDGAAFAFGTRYHTSLTRHLRLTD